MFVFSHNSWSDLADAVNGSGSLDGDVGRGVPGGGGTEGADGGGNKHSQVVLFAQLHYVVQTFDVHSG